MAGFYVPNSQSWSYVANKKDEKGNLIYDDTNINLQKQAALQTLQSDYNQTIENAYASYLAANNNLRGSAMGQGYKELYKQMQTNELINDISTLDAQMAQARQQIEQNAANATEEMQSALNTEVSNFDRLASSFNEYLSYVKGLNYTKLEPTAENSQNTVTYNYLRDVTGMTDDELKNVRADQLYDILTANNGIENYKDSSENYGKTFLEWQRDKLQDTTRDLAYAQWLYDYNASGKTGYQEFLSMPKETKQINRDEVLKEKAAKEATKKKEIEALQSGFDTEKYERVKDDNFTDLEYSIGKNLKPEYQGPNYDYELILNSGGIGKYGKELYNHIVNNYIHTGDLKEKEYKIIEYNNHLYLITNRGGSDFMGYNIKVVPLKEKQGEYK